MRTVRGNYVYRNLAAEMARRGFHCIDLAKVLNITESSTSKKLCGKTTIAIEEAFTIKNKLFPSLTIEYLFEKTEVSQNDG